MTQEMQQNAISYSIQALEMFTIDKDIAMFLKKEFDKKYGRNWQCKVGNMGGYVEKTQLFIYFYIDQVVILLLKNKIDAK